MEQAASLFFKDSFSLDPGDLEKILNLGLARGADFSEIFMEYRLYSSIKMEEDIIKDTAENIMLGMGIRVISGDQTGYGYTNDLSFQSMKRAALTASSIAKGELLQKAVYSKPVSLSHNLYSIHEPVTSLSVKKKISLVKKSYQAALNHDKKIEKVKVVFMDQLRHITVLNSEGLNISDTQPLAKLTCVCLAEENKKREAGFSGGGGRVGMEYFDQDLTPQRIGREAAQEALRLLEAKTAPAGEMPIILAPGHAGVLVHEAVGHLLEADFNRKKTSVFWDRLGKKVANEQTVIFDDPTIPFFRGSYNIDDEGTVPNKTPLVDRGVLVGFLQDRLSAKLMNKPLTGHGRRQDYTCIPIPRMSNTYIDKGDYDPEEILRSVKKGLYAHKFLGGQVEDSGKFTFTISSGFLIEDGALASPIKQATLVGTNIDILQKIEKVGCDLTFGLQTGTCGKEGQANPVTDGCPTLKITRMTVGGLK
jgi:TldD protein